MITYLQQMIQVQRKESDGMVRADGPKSVRVISVIEVKANRGLGIEKDPVRVVTQYWDMKEIFLLKEIQTRNCFPIRLYGSQSDCRILLRTTRKMTGT